jgi:transcriptional regulator with GAF, ATPase, and Fis domain
VKLKLAATSETCTAEKHGTAWTYQRYGCRCREAIADKRGLWGVWQSRNRSGVVQGGHLKHRDVDPMAVERAARGDRTIRHGTAERVLVVQALTAAGLSAAQIARRLGVAPRSVCRIRSRIRQAAA